QAQVDKTITVTAGYTDLLGTPEIVTSTATTAVVNVNDAPTTSVVTLVSIAEHSQARVITQAELLGNAVDLDANTLTATNLSLASSNGTLVDNANGTWSYTPLLNDATSVSFNYTITDSVSPTAGLVAATATLDITPVQLTAEPVADLFKSFGNGTNTYIKPEAYVQNSGQNLDLKYQIIDKSADAVIIGSTSNDFIKLAGTGNKAANGGGGNDVLDGSTGSSFLSGGDGINTFFMDGRATGVTWSTLTDFTQGQDKATIWGWVKGVSTINAGFTDFNTGGATDYTGLTLHIQNLLPDGSVSGATNSALNSLTLTGHTLAQFGASSLADLNTQIINGTNTHFIVGQTTDDLGVHGYLSIS
uniref:cadherin-like domain-containing protein n=1 Tax=Methylobacter psychrophilus TaxID=96941 RepID=UPI0021D49BB3